MAHFARFCIGLRLGYGCPHIGFHLVYKLMIRTNLLWNDVIEHDGRLTKEPTFLGVVLIGIGLIAAFALIIFLGSFL